MSKIAPKISLSDRERKVLQRYQIAGKTEQRLVRRSKIILLAAEGLKNQEIAQQMKIGEPQVCRWRSRFFEGRLSALFDRPRPGKPETYDALTERRILQMLDSPPPSGMATWSGPLLAKALGDVSDDQVWRVLRRHKISLQRRRSWCISTDPQFAPKAADIVGLYLAPPTNAVVICVDEKPHIQALERAQGYLRLPNGRALTGRSHEYTRHGTTTLFAALNVATGEVKGGNYRRRRRVDFLDFMNGVVAEYEGKEIHVILDNLNTHKPKRDMWLARRKNVRFHYTPTHASWLNQIEVWFSILTRQALRGASFESVAQLQQAIEAFIGAYNQTAAPFEWTKAEVHQKALKNKFADLCK